MISDINRGLVCPYCGNKTEVIDSEEIYGKSFGILYICRPCEAWVGAHKNTGEALGRVANAELRKLKIRAHAAFDPLWRNDAGSTYKPMGRRNAYTWLAMVMQVSRDEAHIGMFDIDQCQKVINEIEKIRPSKPISITFP